MPAIKSYKGQTFNRLTILEDGGSYDKVLCLCECGNLKRIQRNSVTSGLTKSCGCLNAETRITTGKLTNHKITHGLSKHRLYPCHKNLIHRCYNPNHPHYYFYGALGTYVCDRWRGDNGLQHFIDDKAETWFEGAQLDKDKFAKPNQPKCYSPETCCWITAEENTFIRNNPNLYPISHLSVFDPFISYKLATT